MNNPVEPYLLTDPAFIPIIEAIFSGKYRYTYSLSERMDISNDRYKSVQVSHKVSIKKATG